MTKQYSEPLTRRRYAVALAGIDYRWFNVALVDDRKLARVVAKHLHKRKDLAHYQVGIAKYSNNKWAIVEEL